MVLIQSRLTEGRISRNELQRHLQANLAISADILCTFSVIDLELFVTPLLVNVKHINSCLHRTMIKRWKYGFNDMNIQHSCRQSDVTPGTTRLQLVQEEKTRLDFTSEYRAAYRLVCQATESIEASVSVLRSKWDDPDCKHRQKAVTAFQQCLFKYCNVVSDLVLSLLPGQTFLMVYSKGTQAEACQVNKSLKTCDSMSCLGW